MITHIESKNNQLQCHNCHIILKELAPQCPFCNYYFSNYEVLILENFKNKSLDAAENL